jgi:hypothetical protein
MLSCALAEAAPASVVHSSGVLQMRFSMRVPVTFIIRHTMPEDAVTDSAAGTAVGFSSAEGTNSGASSSCARSVARVLPRR